MAPGDREKSLIKSFSYVMQISCMFRNNSLFAVNKFRSNFMQAEDFSLLSYTDQLKVIDHSGRLKHSVISNGHQFSVYRVKSFYVELQRDIKQLFFEKITAMDYEHLPAE